MKGETCRGGPPRALARSSNGRFVYAAAYHSGNGTAVLHSR